MYHGAIVTGLFNVRFVNLYLDFWTIIVQISYPCRHLATSLIHSAIQLQFSQIHTIVYPP